MFAQACNRPSVFGWKGVFIPRKVLWIPHGVEIYKEVTENMAKVELKQPIVQEVSALLDGAQDVPRLTVVPVNLKIRASSRAAI